jgi:RNA polymerase sigma factor (sigma-70 family)
MGRRWCSRSVVLNEDTDPVPPAEGVDDPPIADFDVWVRPHLAAMSFLAARLAGDADRDDVVQESLTRAWKRSSTYRPERGSPRAWLLAIVADRARRRHRRPPPAELVSGPAAQVEADLDLEAAIARLARSQRLAVELYYFADLPVAEVAGILGCSEGTVKSTLSDARARLRARLEER